MLSIPIIEEGLALNQNLNPLLLQLFDLGHLQKGHDILNRATMRHRKTKQAFVVLLKLDILKMLVVLVTGTRFEQEHRQTSCQVGGQFIIGDFLRPSSTYRIQANNSGK